LIATSMFVALTCEITIKNSSPPSRPHISEIRVNLRKCQRRSAQHVSPLHARRYR
jgi:hypothetical protein